MMNDSADYMRVRNALEKLKGHDERRTLSSVCIEDGCAYVCDGRIAVKWQFAGPDDIGNDIPDGYPLQNVKQIVLAADSAESWSKISMTYYRNAEVLFLDEYRKEKLESAASDRDRYKMLVCPHCREYVYWDNWSDTLVKEEDREVSPPIEPRDHTYPVILVFGEDVSKKLPVNFGYLLTIRMLFGDDFLFGLEVPQKGDVSKLVFRSEDGMIKGVLMPLRVIDDDDLKGENEIVMLPS